MKILVTGARGFLGSHLVPKISSNNHVVSVSSSDYDLTSIDEVRKCLNRHKPEVVFHLAGLSGGIGANLSRPEKFYFVNTLLIANMFQAASEINVGRLIVPMGGCSYPSTAKSPIIEEDMWSGFPHGASAAYSSAKKMAIVASEAYRSVGLNSTILVPGNMYGEYDNFSLQDSHVVPAIIRKIYEAKLSGAKKIEMWGAGKPVRDFVYVGDVASIMSSFIQKNEITGPINISTGTSISIRDLTENIADKMNFEGEIFWDITKPEGQLVKIFDVTRLEKLGFKCDTSLTDGLEKTISWFEANYSIHGKIRL
jgi:GDP-L-fucose synthase